MSLLPNVLEVADQHGLQLDSKTQGKKEVRTKCPFCHADAGKNKFYLSLNKDKNVFKCWYCKESGGVLRFISLLDGVSEQELIEKIRKKNGSTYKKHPAERLTTSQLQLIGYPKINWVKNREYDVNLYRAFREKVYREWLTYVDKQKELAYKLLFVGLSSGDLKGSIQKVKEMEQEMQIEFLQELLDCLFQESKSDKTFDLECRAAALVGQSHPYEAFFIID
ncbi:CHC2 zinc finger domain-containing protein [Lentibacillus salinarum]|uniref:CHC2 zinc finger domain-containing protein n=1 Tax=Lentibacillus salinarum TaxID=446820 RepID=A0ABW3ZX01_9BACI